MSCPTSTLVSLCRKGDTEQVRKLIKDKADVNVKEAGVSPLMAAIQGDHSDLMELLQGAGAKVDTESNQSIYSYAVDHNAVECYAMLFDGTWDSSRIKDDIRRAIALGHEAIITAMIEVHDHPDACSSELFLHELPSWLSPDTKPEDRPIVDAVIAAGIDGIDVKDTLYGYTPLMHAVKARSRYIVSALLRAYAELRQDLTDWVNYRPQWSDCRSSDPVPALNYAVRNNDLAIVTMLLDARADPNVTDVESRWTPLFYARSVGVARALIAAGADVDHQVPSIVPPRVYASVGYRGDHLVDTPLTKCDHVAEALLRAGTHADLLRQHGRDLLGRAVRRRDAAVVKLLVEGPATRGLWSEADITPKIAQMIADASASDKTKQNKPTQIRDMNAADALGKTRLHRACQRGCSVDTVRSYLARGAFVSARANNGDTPLMLAVKGGHADVVEALLEHLQPEQMDMLNNEGQAALHIAMVEIWKQPVPHCADIIRLMVSAGAAVDVRDSRGRTPLLLACLKPPSRSDHWETVVPLLLELKADVGAADGRGCTALLAATRGLTSDTPLLESSALVTSMSMLLRHATPECVSARDEHGYTALNTAIVRRSASCARLLVEAKAELGVIPKRDSHWRDPEWPNSHRGDSYWREEGWAASKLANTALALLTLAVNVGDAALLDAMIDMLSTAPAPAPAPAPGSGSGSVAAGAAGGEDPARPYSVLVLEAVCLDWPAATISRIIDLGVDLNVKDTRDSLYVREGSDDDDGKSDVCVGAVYLCGYGYAALHYACMFDQLETVRLLLDRGADVNAATEARVEYRPKDSRSDPKVGAFTPLMEAVSQGHVRVVELLLSRMTPEQVNVASAAGETALHIAGRASRLPAMAEIVRQLLAAGAAVDARDALSYTPLMHVCSLMHERSAMPIVSLLLEHRADIRTQGMCQPTLLLAATAARDWQVKDPRGSIELISFLLRGPHVTPEWVNARDFSDYGALNIAVVDGLVDCVRPLLEAKAALLPFYANHIKDLEMRRRPFYTNGIMEMLVDAGTDMSVLAGINQSALYSAVVNYDTALVRLLLRANPPPDVNCRDSNGRTLLFHALSHQGYPTLMMLLAAGADPTIPNNSGNIPLFEAREAGTITALLDAAPRSINHVDGNGRNALMQACLYSQQNPRHFLGHVGALDPDATDRYDDTVLHAAMWMWRTEAVPKLLDLPIDVFRDNRCGHTVMMKPFANPSYHRGAQDDRDISACLAMVSDHVLRMPAVQGRTRKEPGDADGGSSSHKVAPKRRRR